MRVAFRADASREIGTGHVMRCLTLADALRACGADAVFVCRAHVGHLCDAIAARGYEVMGLPAPAGQVGPAESGYRAWLGVDWQQDAEDTYAALRARGPFEWLVVDHYSLDARWESSLRRSAARLLAIDDLANRAHDCDVLLDQNFGSTADRYLALVPPACEVLAGSDYSLLRPEFAAHRELCLQRPRRGVRRVLVSMGGVDKDNATGAVLRGLQRTMLQDDCVVDVVMGSGAPWLDDVRRMVPTMRRPVRLHVDVRDMAGLMAEADLAIGAAGSSSWERCCLGIPTILAVLADNQRATAIRLAEAGAAIVVDGDLSERLPPIVERLMREPAVLAGLGAAASAIVDGRGVQRVVQRLVPGGDGRADHRVR